MRLGRVDTRSTNIRDKISDAQYELESLSKEVKAAVKPVLPNGGQECV